MKKKAIVNVRIIDPKNNIDQVGGILINELGAEKLKSLIESKFKKFADKKLLLEEDEIKKIKNYFKLPINDPIKSSI